MVRYRDRIVNKTFVYCGAHCHTCWHEQHADSSSTWRPDAGWAYARGIGTGRNVLVHARTERNPVSSTGEIDPSSRLRLFHRRYFPGDIPVIYACTPAGKRELARILEDEDPDFLAELTMLAGKLGKFTAVGYLSDDPGKTVRVFTRMETAKRAYIAKLPRPRVLPPNPTR